MSSPDDEFYLRYFVGHKSQFGNEFLELELQPSGKLRYANNSNYKHDRMIRREVFLSPAVVDEIRRIILTSEITKVDDKNWPEPDESSRRQELEIKIGNQHIAFLACEIGSLADIQRSPDPEGLKTFYYLVQDIKAMVLSLIHLHFTKNPF
jgi:protein mago nashi